MDLEIQLSAGLIKRYHTITIIGEQTVAAHSYNVVQILRHITDDMLSINLLKAALDHDAMEYFTGDTPYPTKQTFPQISKAIHDVEDELLRELGIDYELTEKEVLLLRWADAIEAGTFGKHQVETGNRNALAILANIVIFFSSQKGMPQKLLDMVNEIGGYLDARK
jgi:5'-deoxynucleotidase YfbR-like HD superfamily hydrolase